MAPSASSSGPRPPHRAAKRMRNKLRNGTFIIPSTGERSRRQLTLRTSSSLESHQRRRNSFREVFSAESLRGRVRAAYHNAGTALSMLWAWLRSPNGRGVLKCSLAYLLGSTATFWPPLSNFLGNRDGKHIVATITVYFHPARTVGSMLEAAMMSVCSVFYAEVISVLSMVISVVVGTQLGHLMVAHVLEVVLFIGCGLGFIGWIKQRLNSPLGNVASTLASIAIISVVTKEEAVNGGSFSAAKIVQMLKMLVMGISITAAVNLLVWRVSARKNLRGSLTASSVNLGDMLAVITRSFLNGSEEELNSSDFQVVSSQYTSLYTAMAKDMREAKFEYYAVGYENQYKLEKTVAKSMENIAQAIGGLRSACNTQFTLLNEKPADGASGTLSPGTSIFSPTLTRAMSNYLKHARERFATLDAIDESEEEASQTLDSILEPEPDHAAPPPLFRMPSEIFELFIALLGPSMKSLAYTLAEILHAPQFGEAPGFKITINEHFRPSLVDALSLYDSARASALQELYKGIELGRTRSEKIEADIEEVAAACGHFSFSLLTVAEEIEAYLDAVDCLEDAIQTRTRSWEWAKVWKWRAKQQTKHQPATSMLDLEEQQGLLQSKPSVPVKPIRKSALPKGIPDEMRKQRDTYKWRASPDTSKTLRRVSQKMLGALRVLGRDDIRFGIKVAVGAMLWAMFAFIPATRPTYQHWRGEWGLLSFMIVVAMTVDASNTTSIARFLGTIIGASLALLGWVISGGNAVVLLALGWLVSLYNFYLVLVVKNGPLGRISLLAWNVTVLYAYSLSQTVDDDDGDDMDDDARPLIFEICYHRVVAVTLGILWGMIVCRLIWPISGRAKFREGLSVLYLQLGLTWKRGPLAVLLRDDDEEHMSFLKPGEQAALQRYAFKLESLRLAAGSEFSLRGPFPVEAYGRILASTRRILDGFYAMSLVENKRGHLRPVEKALMDYTAEERAQLCDRICHVFHVMASSAMLEYPMTDAIPSISGGKDRLLGKIYQFRRTRCGEEEDDDDDDDAADRGNGSAKSRKQQQQQFIAEEKDYALLYAYILVTAQVAEELGKVGKEIEGLFGVFKEDSLLLQ